MTNTALGRIVLAASGETACREGYGTTDPHWVGFYAVQYGDIDTDGTLT